jgi:hypothetical protein
MNAEECVCFNLIRFLSLTAIHVIITVGWDSMLCHLVVRCACCKDTYQLHHQ